MVDDDAVRIQGSIPKSEYEWLQQKFPASADKDSNLLRAAVDRLRRLEELEEMRATGSRELNEDNSE